MLPAAVRSASASTVRIFRSSIQSSSSRCVRFKTTVTDDPATLATGRALPPSRSTGWIAPASPGAREQFLNLMKPAVDIGLSAFLNSYERVAELASQRTDGSVRNGKFAPGMADAANGSDNSGGPTRKNLPQPAGSGIFPPPAEGIGHLLDAQAGIPRNCDQGGTGNTWQDRSKRRCDERSILHHEENIHSSKFLDPTVFCGIEEYNLITSFLCRLRLGKKAGGIVSTAFRRPRPTRGSPAEGIRNPYRDRLLAALEICSDRTCNDAKCVF